MHMMPLLAAALLTLSGCDSQTQQFLAADQDDVALSQETVLAPGRWVTDAAGIIDEAAEVRMTQKLQGLERATGHQMVVVTVPTLEGETIDQYTLRLANSWSVGRREHNDGIVLLVAPNERQARIEVGLGLEDVVTNGFASSVLETDMIPRLRQGNYSGGITAGLDNLIGRLSDR